MSAEMVRIYDLAIEGSLLLLIIFTPLAFGTVYPWGMALIEWMVLLMVLTWAFKLLHTGKVRVVRTPLNFPILLFLGLVGLQLVPLPPAALQVVSPNTYALYQRTLDRWQGQEALPLAPPEAVSPQPVVGQIQPPVIGQQSHRLPPLPSEGRGQGWESSESQDGFSATFTGVWRPLSLYAHPTWEALFLALTYAAVFLVVVNTFQTHARLTRLLCTLLTVGGMVAVVGLIQKVSGTAKIYWFWQPQEGGNPFGPYVNRNHFAGYMVMLIPLGLGWLWGRLAQGDQGMRRRSWRESLSAVVSGRDGQLLLLMFALVNMAAALLFSASRGGIVSFVSALLAFTLLAYVSPGERRYLGIMVPVLAALALAYALWLGIDHVVARFFQHGDDRPTYWSATLRLVGDFPLLGTGLGTYVYSFRRYNPILAQVLVDHAHNEYLELLAETGAVGFLLVVGGLGWFSWRTLLRWLTRHDPEVCGIVLGGLTSVLAIGIHSIMDFNLQVPANALLLAVVLGLTSVAVHLRQHHRRSVVTFRVRERHLPRALRLAAYPVSLLLALALAVPIGKGFAADRQAQLADRVARGAVDTAVLESVVEQWAQAVALDPGNADYHYHLGQAHDRLMQLQWSSDPAGALVSGVRAMAAYREAILRNPTASDPYLAWGLALESVSQLALWTAENRDLIASPPDGGGNTLEQLITQLVQHPERASQWSRQLVQTAIHLDPTTASSHYTAGLYGLQRWETLSPEDRERVIQQLRSAVQLEPKNAAAILQALWEQTQDRELVRALARGTPDEARWRGDGGRIVGGR
jgi:O-antigen ligase